MREAVAGYVQEIHRAYVDQAATFSPGVRGRMPLMPARPDHSGGRRGPQPAPARDHGGAGPAAGAGGRAWTAAYAGLAWELRFYDPVVLPDLGLLEERDAPAFEEVKRALGVGTVLYHVVAQPGAGLSGHQATHVGTGLANGHSAAARDFETIRARARGSRGTGRRAGRCGGRRAAARPGAAGPRDLALRRGRPRGLRGRQPGPGRDPQGGPERRRWPHPVAARRERLVAPETGVTDGGLSSVGNAARLLKAFLSREKEIGVSELARRLDLGQEHRAPAADHPGPGGAGRARPTDRRLPARADHVRARPGRARRTWTCTGRSAPVLAALREETHEGCQVGVLDGHEVVYIDRLESSQTLRLFNETGRRVPVHTTSSGKTLLAHLTEPELEAVLAAASPLAQMTPKSVTDPAVLRTELARIRARGWSEAVEEREIGVASIAAPIRDASGQVVAAISIGGPSRPDGAPSSAGGWPRSSSRPARPPRGGSAGRPSPDTSERADAMPITDAPARRGRSTTPAGTGSRSSRSPTRTRRSAWPTATPSRRSSST